MNINSEIKSSARANYSLAYNSKSNYDSSSSKINIKKRNFI